jgi:ribose 5-phosphate isomerase RpiB
MSAKQVALARQQADASLLVIGSVHHSLEQAKELVSVFLATEFGDLLEDARRIINITEFENSGTIEGWMIGYED